MQDAVEEEGCAGSAQRRDDSKPEKEAAPDRESCQSLREADSATDMSCKVRRPVA